MRTYKYRIYPSDKQKRTLEKYFWCCRFVYNYMLDMKKTMYKRYWVDHNMYRRFDLNNELAYLKKQLPWLKDCPSQMLQDQMRILTIAYENFLSWLSWFPKFKKKKSYQSITFPQFCSIKWDYIVIPKIKNIKVVIHRWIPNWVNIKTMTIIKESNWQYYVSIVTDDTVWKPSTEENKVWIDVWLSHYATFSDWTVIDNPRYLKKSLKRLKRYQRKLSKKTFRSKNYEKQRIKVAKVYFRVSCQKRDFLHKLSRMIANQYWFVAVEDLWIRDMIENNNTDISREIASASWWTFFRYLWYKTKVVKVWRYDATSQICSRCWNKKENLTLADRIYRCEKCWVNIDRDKNAAINILNIAIDNKKRFKKTLEEISWVWNSLP